MLENLGIFSANSRSVKKSGNLFSEQPVCRGESYPCKRAKLYSP